jgi:hypothetical protein
LLKWPSFAARLRALAMMPALCPGAVGQDTCLAMEPPHSGHTGVLDAFINNSNVLSQALQ